MITKTVAHELKIAGQYHENGKLNLMKNENKSATSQCNSNSCGKEVFLYELANEMLVLFTPEQ